VKADELSNNRTVTSVDGTTLIVKVVKFCKKCATIMIVNRKDDFFNELNATGGTTGIFSGTVNYYTTVRILLQTYDRARPRATRTKSWFNLVQRLSVP